MNQIIFDRNLASKEFVDIFRTEENYSASLDEKANETAKIVDKKTMDFIQDHVERQTKMVRELVDQYVKSLKKLAAMNGGFPDTEAMRTALFGQVAFKYEQKCQKIYKLISDKIIGETIVLVKAKLDSLEGKQPFV